MAEAVRAHWVLLRGLTRERAHWGDFVQRVEAALPDARVHLWDLPGNGERHRERSPLSVADMVADCRRQMAQRGIPAPVHLLALSLGAMVARQWMNAAPQEIASAVLVNTSMRPFSPVHHRLQPHNLAPMLRLMAGGLSPEQIERIVWRMTSRQRTVDAATLAAWTEARRLRPVSVANAARQLLAAARFRAPAPVPERPTLLLSSDGDRLVNPRCSERLARAWGCAWARHPDAGHDLVLDDVDWVIGQLRRWSQADQT